MINNKDYYLSNQRLGKCIRGISILLRIEWTEAVE